ncbi:hypothetical protein AK812_SmicGene32985 [Symbiodinium microadriaticum]|uniref:Uncharacterized protein n=1 Tax=Symbiodinium microadriaticum TaxID=2951 RepID=A0A1Q9CSR4_SYMMI|nr:hypothetical protein AK812_SmicGene32985 [Symbiodinium microadriaticum]
MTLALPLDAGRLASVWGDDMEAASLGAEDLPEGRGMSFSCVEAKGKDPGNVQRKEIGKKLCDDFFADDGEEGEALLARQGFGKAELMAAFRRFDVRKEGW